MIVNDTKHCSKNSPYEKRVLIIDDNFAIHDDFKKILQKKAPFREALLSIEAELFGSEDAGPIFETTDTFQLDSAFQGQEGIALVERSVQENRPYMVAFVDMRMPPGCNGVETIERIWPIDPDLNIVICSAYSDCPWDEISARFVDKSKQLLFLSKPFQAIEVWQIASALTCQWQLAREVREYRNFLEREIEKRTRELKSTERKYRTIFEKMHEAALLISPDDFTVVDANIQSATLLGSAPDTLKGSDCRRLFSGRLLKRIEAIVHESGAVSDSLIDRIVHSVDGRSIEIEASAARIPMDEKNYLLVLLRDISKRRLLESQLLRAQKLESIGQLAAGVAHEINTPTQYVGDNTQFLLDAFNDIGKILTAYETVVADIDVDSKPGSPLHRLAQLIDEVDLHELMKEIPLAIGQSMEGIHRVTEIVRALKSFSHPGEKGKTLSNINEALKNTITVARNEWKYVADVEIRLDDALPLVECHLGELNQVFLNIIVNAAQAIEEEIKKTGKTGKGRISVCSELLDGDIVEIRFEDNGPGIPSEIIDKVFDPFFTTKEVGKGTGQGLAIAYAVVTDMHGGDFKVYSEPGSGACFTIRIPISSS